MARPVDMDVLEKKIQKAQENVSRAREAYEAATDSLKALLDKRDAVRQQKLIAAVANSAKSYEEIMKFLTK